MISRFDACSRDFSKAKGLPSENSASAQEFINQYDQSCPGCLPLDVRIPGASGLELQGLLTEQGVLLPMIFMTAYANLPMSVRAMKAGPLDSVQKRFDEQRLLEAVHRALEQDRHFRRTADDRQAAQRRFRLLTRRERHVLELVVAGKTNREIAEQWGISQKTVKIHRSRMIEKMQANSPLDLVLLDQAAGICTTKVVFD
jgi:RNA polymerase sigma factor (sigma-70 family)